eukprot:3611402-Rhodomonas_salina.2
MSTASSTKTGDEGREMEGDAKYSIAELLQLRPREEEGAVGGSRYSILELLQLRPGISLHACYAMSGTDVVYGSISLRARYAMPITEIAYDIPADAFTVRCPVLKWCFWVPDNSDARYTIGALLNMRPQVKSASFLCACYTMSGTHMSYGDIYLLLACYTMSGTDTVYGATRGLQRTGERRIR